MYNEFKEFKNEYSEKIRELSQRIEDNNSIKYEENKNIENTNNDLKEKALKFINISMMTKTKNVADHLGISDEQAFNLLLEMVRHDESISCGGQLRKENMHNITWTKKRNK